MLVLSRQRDETIVFDFSKMTADDFEELKKKPIEVTTVDIRGDKVRTGIEAPKFVVVHRREVYDAIKREQQAREGKPDGYTAGSGAKR